MLTRELAGGVLRLGKAIAMAEDFTPYTPRVGARLSASSSASTSKSSNVPDIRTVREDDYEYDTYALAQIIEDHWGVEDAQLIVLEHGARDVAAIHRRMLWLSKRQLLAKVRNKGGYFMTALIRMHKPRTPVDERSDDFYEEYRQRQRDRGMYDHES